MKYGLIYAPTSNIGDDIQCYAAMLFLPAVDYFIDRENLIGDINKYITKPTKIIFNGWWCHNPKTWFINEYVDPLFISMHLIDKAKSSFVHFLQSANIKQPIGCRDIHTLKFLQSQGIKSYFSGCLTLTLPKLAVTKDIETLYVDPHDVIIDPASPKNKNMHISNGVKGLLRCSASNRIKMAEKHLETYARSRRVVTSRLHCFLPCKAMGVAVEFKNNSRDMKRRISGYEDITQKRIQTIRKQLVKRVEEFIQNE